MNGRRQWAPRRDAAIAATKGKAWPAGQLALSLACGGAWRGPTRRRRRRRRREQRVVQEASTRLYSLIHGVWVMGYPRD
jgi:hypothetical protein